MLLVRCLNVVAVEGVVDGALVVVVVVVLDVGRAAAVVVVVVETSVFLGGVAVGKPRIAG